MRNILLFTAFIFTLCTYSQVRPDASVKEKELYIETLDFIDEEKYEFAERNYQKLISIDSTYFTYLFELGMLYFYEMQDKGKSIRWLNAAANQLNGKSDLNLNGKSDWNVYIYLAQAYQFIQKYEKALEIFRLYDGFPLKEGQIKINVSNYIERCNYAKDEEEKQRKNMKFRVMNVGPEVNTPFSEYASVQIFEDSTMLFTSRRSAETDTLKKIYDKFWEYMYFTKKTGGSLSENTGRFTDPINFSTIPKYSYFGKKSTWHKAIVSIYPDYSKLIIFQKQKLWTSTMKEGIWQKPKKLPKEINFGEYQRHASITADGKTMFFSAYPKSGSDQFDIYYSTIDDDGKWKPAQTLGSVINTSGDEDSPEITPDGKTLYFSSNGHPGMGNYDVFRSELIDGEWTSPVNMGYPINSPADDIFFKRNGATGVSYVSSSRVGGFGIMDIYSVFPVVYQPDFDNCVYLDDSDWGKYNIDIISPDSIFTQKPAKFEATLFKAGNNPERHYFWNFGNGKIALDKQVAENTFENDGLFKVTLQCQGWNDETSEEINFCISKNVFVLSEAPVIADVVKTTENTESIENQNSSNNTNNTNNTNLLPEESLKAGLQPVYFSFNQNGIRTDASLTLNSNISILKNNPQMKFAVHAHTDCIGSSEYNFVLSQRRAESTVEYLVKNGIDRARIVDVKGFGETKPINNCIDGAACSKNDHQLNRRVEFIISQ
ncbi:MAG: hypothetical protein A2W91_17445 [Bacteroidetes bacterium GWF2_38_335]|nr:MAG: hypothetical protein A2W91_17445 [Bacteroidetes bacterium GWF2_38_335]